MKTCIEIECSGCGTSFLRRKAEHSTAIKRGQKSFYCSKFCLAEARLLMPRMIRCQYCNTLFNRRGTTKRLYCSQSCAASFNNTLFIKRKRGPGSEKCSRCGGTKGWSSDQCRSCYYKYTELQTLEQLKKDHSIHKYHVKIRGYSRSRYKGPRMCAVCSYSKYIDICHIKAIKDFPMTATLAEVNADSNLVALCKLHHWELDHGDLDIGRRRATGVGWA